MAQVPDLSYSEIARAAGVDPRTVGRSLGELEDRGYIVRSRVGKGNRYSVQVDAPIELERNLPTVGQLLGGFGIDLKS